MNERLESGISDFATYRARREEVLDAFSGLPLADGVKASYFAKLFTTEGPDALRSKVEIRYKRICDIRADAGLAANPVLDNEMLVVLLDDKLFDSVITGACEDAETISVSRHELGHAVVADNLGWHVKSMTVVPNGYYLGLTESAPPPGLRFDDWLLESAAISYGGKIAATVSGDKVKGIGADMASVAVKARMALSMPGSRFSNEESFMREAENIAIRAIRNVGISNLNRMANRLVEIGTEAA